MVDQEISTKSEAEGGTKRTMSVRLAVFLVLGMMLLLIAGVLAYRSAMNFQGYCLAEGVILSENEKIRRAIEDRLKVYPPAALEEHHSQDGLNWSIPFKPKHPVY
jgi:hypothetical protein